MKKKAAHDTTETEGMLPHNGRSRALLTAALRVLAIVLSISGLVVMVTDKQMSRTPIYIPFLNASLSVRKMAYYSLFTSFKSVVSHAVAADHLYWEGRYLVWANAIAAVVALAQLIAQLVCPRQSKIKGWVTLLSDQAMAYLLLGAAAASSDVAYLAKNGINYIGWSEHCSNYGRFCTRACISVILTYFSMLVFAILSMTSAHRLCTILANKSESS